MELRPIVSSLRRHKTAAALIVAEVALSCAIICNAVFLIHERLARLNVPSGVAENELLDIRISGIGKDANAAALTRQDLTSLRAIPGVTAVATSVQVPFGNSSWNSSVTLQPNQANASLNASMYMGSQDLLETLGTRIVAGRDFRPDEYQPFPADGGLGQLQIAAVIITRPMAEKLFPGKRAVGQHIYFGDDKAVTVVGVVDRLIRPYLSSSDPDGAYSMVLPILTPYDVGGQYLLRTAPDQRQRVLRDAVATLQKNAANRLIEHPQPLEHMRTEFFRQDRAMVWLLLAVIVALLVVTALGIVGLASFWVQQRTRQIGVRRALGATRGQILRYFQTENFLLATLGIVLGMALAYGINGLLMQHYELPRLPLWYLPIGALTLWALGQIAVLGPAWRAAAVPPAVATRSV
ncbi:MAG: ABC transporter permease [Proteobacteria bacterium]|nr:ABC transporter permease [Pseudomonadota bacterium]